MNITINKLSGESLNVNVDGDITVRDLKHQIKNELLCNHGTFNIILLRDDDELDNSSIIQNDIDLNTPLTIIMRPDADAIILKEDEIAKALQGIRTITSKIVSKL